MVNFRKKNYFCNKSLVSGDPPPLWSKTTLLHFFWDPSLTGSWCLTNGSCRRQRPFNQLGLLTTKALIGSVANMSKLLEVQGPSFLRPLFGALGPYVWPLTTHKGQIGKEISILHKQMTGLLSFKVTIKNVKNRPQNRPQNRPGSIFEQIVVQ